MNRLKHTTLGIMLGATVALVASTTSGPAAQPDWKAVARALREHGIDMLWTKADSITAFDDVSIRGVTRDTP